MLLLVVLGGAALYLFLRPRPPRAGFSTELANLGEILVGAESAAFDLDVANVGELPMRVDRIGVEGPAAVEFGVTGEDCTGGSLEAGEICRVQLVFTPVEMGLREARLELHGGLRKSPAVVALSGRGVAPVLEVDSRQLPFAPADVGSRGESRAVTVTNAGSAPLGIDGLEVAGGGRGEFERRDDDCSGERLQPGESCSIRFAFVPRAAGERRAEVAFRSDAFGEVPRVELSGTGIWSGPTLSLETERLDFGERLLAAEAETRPVRLTNRQSAAVEGLTARIEEGGGFTITGNGCGQGVVQPGASCAITIAFRPRREESYEAELVIRHAGAESIRVPLLGRGVSPRLQVSVSELDFGRVRVSEPSATLEVAMKNLGSAAAPVDRVEIGGEEGSTFRKTRDGCTGGRVAPGAECAVEVRFRPRREGTHGASLSISPPPAEGPGRISLIGFGTAPRLVVDRESLDFGEVRRTMARTMSLKLANRGTERLRIEGIATSGAGSASFVIAGGSCRAPAVLEPGGECLVSLRFAPKGDGRVTARLDLEHDAWSGPRSVPLAGSGLPPPIPRITVAPAALDFGSQPVGQRSSIQRIRVANAGTGLLRLVGFRVLGEHADDFRIVPATCDAVPELVPGSDCSVGIRFLPTGPGDRTARLVIRHSAATGELVLELRGRGI